MLSLLSKLYRILKSYILLAHWHAKVIFWRFLNTGSWLQDGYTALPLLFSYFLSYRPAIYCIFQYYSFR